MACYISSDDEALAALLADMSDTPTLSPIKSPPKKRPADTEDPSVSALQPPTKRLDSTDESFKPLRNKLAYIQTRKAKATKSLTYLKEYRTKAACPVGLQFRPKPHMRQDNAFQTAMNKICREAEQKLLNLMIQKQEQNIEEDETNISSLTSQIKQLFPDNKDHKL